MQHPMETQCGYYNSLGALMGELQRAQIWDMVGCCTFKPVLKPPGISPCNQNTTN